MAESPDLYAEVAAMRNQLDDVASMTAALLRSNPQMSKEVLEFLSKDTVARCIYLLTDGTTSQTEIVKALEAKKIKGGTRSGVSRKIEILTQDYHLLARDHRSGKSNVYRKTEIASALHIDRLLTRQGLGTID